MRVGAVIVSYNSENDLGRCLDAVASCDIEACVVVDNVSADGSVNVAKAKATIVVESEINVGFGAGVNRGVVALPEVDAYLLVNPDCVVTRATINRLVDAMSERVNLAAVVPTMCYLDGTFGISGGPQISVPKEVISVLRLDRLAGPAIRHALLWIWRRLGWPRFLGFLDVQPAEGLLNVEWVSGFCMLVRADAFHSVAGFDEDFFMYFEDVDLCDRLRSRGWTVAIDKGAIAMHAESVSALVVGKSRLYRAGLQTYFRKHGSHLERAIIKYMVGTK